MTQNPGVVIADVHVLCTYVHLTVIFLDPLHVWQYVSQHIGIDMNPVWSAEELTA